MSRTQAAISRVTSSLRSGLPLPSESERSASERAESMLPPEHPVWEVWERMAEIYGHKWGSQYGDMPSDTWCRGVASLTDRQLARGLSACLERKDVWPPNLAEFRQLCTGDDGVNWERQCHRIYQPDRLLEDATQKAKTAAEAETAIARMKELFR